MASDAIYTTQDEVKFIKDLAKRDPNGFRRYAAIVLGGYRTYDYPGMSVDVGQVHKCIRQQSKALASAKTKSNTPRKHPSVLEA